MPVMDGFSCAESIRSKLTGDNHIPIIAVTANLMAADKKHCLEAGINDYLAKPVSIGVLKECLAGYIEMPQKAQAYSLLKH